MYIKPDYAKAGRLVTIDVPYEENQIAKNDRSVAATVIRFPVEAIEQKIEKSLKSKRSAQIRDFNPALVMKRLELAKQRRVRKMSK